MKVIFAGSPLIAVPALEAIIAEHEIILAGVLTNPDTSKGRSGKLEPTDVGAVAEKISKQFFAAGKPALEILKPEKLDSAVREQIAALNPDLLVSFAYGRIFGPKFLSLFPMGGINVHPSLLPKYRGATPIPAAILNRDSETGISIQKIAPEMDCGDILAKEIVQLNGRETTENLNKIMAEKAAGLLPRVLKDIAAGKTHETPQNHAEAGYCSLIKKEDGIIDWNLSALEIDARIRAFDPWPLCSTTYAGQLLYILEAVPIDAEISEKQPGLVFDKDKKQGILIQTGNGVLAVKALQLQGKKPLEWLAFLNGSRNFIGSRLGVQETGN